MKKLLLALLIVAFVAAPAFASVQNVKVGGSINSMFVSRANFDFGNNYSPEGDETQNFFATQTKIQVDADLTDNVAATVAIINERAWGNENEGSVGSDATNTDIDLHLAYVTLKEMLYSPLTVVIGRQAFCYGNSLIIDSAGGSIPDAGLNGVASDLSMYGAMDAIRLILDYNPLTVELLYSKIDANTLTATNNGNNYDNKDDVDLYGINATYELGDDMNTQIEGYFFAKIDKEPLVWLNDGTKADTVYVPGIRVSTTPLEGLNLSVEYAHQSGTKSSTTDTNQQSRDANAVQIMTSYQLPVLEEYKPLATYSYTYVSGDSNSDSGDFSYNAWDPMFEYQGVGTIYNTLFSLSNMQIHSVALEAQPVEDVTTTLTWSGLWMAKDAYNSSAITLNQPDGTTVSGMAVEGKSALGNEVDFDVVYDYTEDVTIGASLGWFFPGNAINKDYRDAATQAILNVNVDF